MSRMGAYGSPIFKAVQQKRCTALYFQRVHPVIAYSPSLRGGFAYQSMGFDWHTPPGQQPPTTKLATTIRATMHIVIRFIVFLLIFGDSGFVWMRGLYRMHVKSGHSADCPEIWTFSDRFFVPISHSKSIMLYYPSASLFSDTYLLIHRDTEFSRLKLNISNLLFLRVLFNPQRCLWPVLTRILYRPLLVRNGMVTINHGYRYLGHVENRWL